MILKCRVPLSTNWNGALYNLPVPVRKVYNTILLCQNRPWIAIRGSVIKQCRQGGADAICNLCVERIFVDIQAQLDMQVFFYTNGKPQRSFGDSL